MHTASALDTRSEMGYNVIAMIRKMLLEIVLLQ